VLYRARNLASERAIAGEVIIKKVRSASYMAVSVTSVGIITRRVIDEEIRGRTELIRS
jgi:putative exporter of polyketide antibiotics